MKIKNIMLKNFAEVKEITVNIGPGITYLIGENGASKTTVGLNGLWFILKGLAQKGDVFHGERFRFIGPYGKSAKGEVNLFDEENNIEINIKRKLTKGKTDLEIKASDGRELGQKFLDNLFNVFLINPWGFVELSAKEQALSLGVDTSEYDQKRKDLYDERTEINREVTRLKGVVETAGSPEPVKMIDVQTLMEEQEEIEKKNKAIEQKANEERGQKLKDALLHNQAQEKIVAEKNKLTEDIDYKQGQINRLQKEIKDLKAKVDSLPPPQPLISTDIKEEPLQLEGTSDIKNQIASATEINERAMKYNQYKRDLEALEKAKAEKANKEEELEQIDHDKISYIQAQKLPFSNMGIDENGGLLVEGKPFKPPYFSAGEIGRMVPKLMASQNPGLKFVWVPESQNIDETNRKALFEALAGQGFQVMAELVGTKKRQDYHSILLREGEIVESYEDKGEGEEL